MKIGAVVCEYNPFHIGHRLQLETARHQLELDAIVGIMSGNFVQRGDVAIFPKHLRAKAALSCGMDLVLELPAVLTLQSAERYAKNAITTLNALGCVDVLFFGAECPDTEVLLKIAEVLAFEDTPFKNALRSSLDSGMSFASARASAIRTVIGSASAEILSRPNNILAVEYCKALLQCNSTIKPVALLREGPDHDAIAPRDGLASASSIRERLLSGQEYKEYLPEETLSLYQDIKPFSLQKLEKAILANLCLMPIQNLKQIADVVEGLENPLHREALQSDSLSALIDSVKSKRYAYSRLRRILLCAYLGITQADSKLTPSYIRILDFNQVGQSVLSLARNTAALPLAKNGGQIKNSPEALKLWQRELAIDQVYNIFRKDTAV